jgi:hypothetical protein
LEISGLKRQACLCTPANAGFFVFGLREIHQIHLTKQDTHVCVIQPFSATNSLYAAMAALFSFFHLSSSTLFNLSLSTCSKVADRLTFKSLAFCNKSLFKLT